VSSPADVPALHRTLSGMLGRRGPEVRATITARDIRRFAVATGETDPIYFTTEAAIAAGYDAIPAPPLMLSSVIEWDAGPPLSTLREDGTGVGKENWLPLDGYRLMGGGQDLVFHAPATAGTEFIAQPALESATLREGSSGALLLLVIATEFRSAAGTALLTCRETLIAR
jgi:acyl dehydratase